MNRKTAVLIIHGFLGSIDDNIFLEETLKKENYDVYSFNLPGHGQSKRIKNITRHDWIDFSCNEVKKLIDANYKNIILVGHSLGGVIASIIATNPVYEKYISKVILIAPAINYYGSKYSKRLYLRRIFRNFVFLFRNKPTIKDVKGANFKMIFEFLGISREHKETVLKVGQPLLIIHGTKDEIIPIEYNRELFEKILSTNKTFVEIQDGNHLLLLFDKKDETVAKILEFISS